MLKYICSHKNPSVPGWWARSQPSIERLGGFHRLAATNSCIADVQSVDGTDGGSCSELIQVACIFGQFCRCCNDISVGIRIFQPGNADVLAAPYLSAQCSRYFSACSLSCSQRIAMPVPHWCSHRRRAWGDILFHFFGSVFKLVTTARRTLISVSFRALFNSAMLFL